MEMLVTTRKHSYLINDTHLSTVEVGSTVFVPSENKLYIVLAPGELTQIGVNVLSVDSLDKLMEAIAAGEEVRVIEHIDAPTGFIITADTTITNDAEIAIPEDTEGNGVFKVTEGTLTLNGKGTFNGVGKNNWNMTLWATDNGKIIIEDGYFTNVGATAEVDPTHFDLIYASVNGQVEILGGEFKCETPAWTLNVKDRDRATASIIVKGGKFHGFNPADCASEGEHTSFVAPGYKVVETDGVFEVMPE